MVGGTVNLQSKDVPISENGTTTITADEGYDGLSDVDVTVNVVSDKNASINTTANYKGSNKSSGINYCITSLPEIDFSNSSTNTSYAFYNMASLTEILIKSSSTSNVTNMSDMFANCTSLITVPLFDTSSVTSMKDMFYGCSSLTTVPLFDTSSVTSMQNMLTICTSLTDTSLDNILQMCINAVNYTDIKTLSRLSLSPSYYPAARIQALPHYQDFIDAGWTIGY